MAKLFDHNGTGCRACGATHAPVSDEKLAHEVGLCSTCWRKFWWHLGEREFTNDLLNKWLARQLYLATRRLKVYGVAGRCEALSDLNSDYERAGRPVTAGHQCAMSATMMRDGHRVCGIHGLKSKLPHYVGERQQNPYDDFTDLLTHLAKVDADFRACLQQAITNAS